MDVVTRVCLLSEALQFGGREVVHPSSYFFDICFSQVFGFVLHFSRRSLREAVAYVLTHPNDRSSLKNISTVWPLD